MKVYRLCKRKYARNLDGRGAELYGGRWNEAGTPMIYTSSTRSLAMLEVLTGIPRQQYPEGYVIVTIKLPTNPIMLPMDSLPANWQTYPAPAETIALGTQWIQKQKSLSLSVPSVIMPEERNILINPFNDAFEDVNIENVKDYTFDRRLVGWKDISP